MLLGNVISGEQKGNYKSTLGKQPRKQGIQKCGLEVNVGENEIEEDQTCEECQLVCRVSNSVSHILRVNLSSIVSETCPILCITRADQRPKSTALQFHPSYVCLNILYFLSHSLCIEMWVTSSPEWVPRKKEIINEVIFVLSPSDMYMVGPNSLFLELNPSLQSTSNLMFAKKRDRKPYQ